MGKIQASSERLQAGMPALPNSLSNGVMTLQQFGNCFCVVESRVMHGCLAVHIPGIYIGSILNQQFGNSGLVRVGRCVKRCRPPMIVPVMSVYVCPGAQEEGDGLDVAFPGGAV